MSPALRDATRSADGKDQSNRRSFARNACGVDLPIVRDDRLTNDGQPEARPARLRRNIGLEDVGKPIRLDPAARIRDEDFRRRTSVERARPDAQADGPGSVAGVYRVEHDVGE